MNRQGLVLSLSAVLVALIPAARSIAAQSGQFTVTQHTQTVGTASYQFSKGPTGYNSASMVKVNMQGLNYALSKTEQLDANHHLQHVVASGTVNGSAVTVIAKPDAAQFLLNISANGHSTTTRLATHANTVFLADLDPGALQNLLDMAAASNGRGLWAIIPKQAGSINSVQIATYPDEHGTLDGSPMTVHHAVATIGQEQIDLFASPANRLMQAELPQEGFTLLRKGFVLTPPKKPIAPPAGTVPAPVHPPAQPAPQPK